MRKRGVEIEILGGIRLRIDGRGLDLPPGSRQERLLAYLLLHAGEAVPRSRAGGTLWPELDEAGARRRLSDALYLLHGVLPEGRLRVDKQSVGIRLAAADRCDLLDLLAMMSSADARPDRMLALAGESLLPSFDEEWATSAAASLRTRYCDRLEALAGERLAHRSWDESRRIAERVAAIDPLREGAHRTLMLALDGLGRRGEALEVHARLASRLEEELGAAPSDETRRVGAALRGTARPPHQGGLAAQVALVGRDSERDALLGLLDRAVDGVGGLRLIEGEAGIGKSRLLEDVAAHARWRGFQVGVGRPAGRNLVATILDGMLTPLRVQQLTHSLPERWRRLLARRLPRLGGGATPGAPFRPGEAPIAEAMLELTLALARIHPLLLVLDDMHESSPEDWDLLLHVSQGIEAHPLFLIAACRPGPVREAPEVWSRVQRLARRAGGAPLELGPLDAPRSRQLLREALGPVRSADADGLFRLTAGNPMFLLESAASLVESGRLAWQGREWRLRGTGLGSLRSARIEEAITARLARLPPESLELVRLTSLDPEPLLLRDLVEVAGTTGPEVLSLAADLVQRRLWREMPDGFAPAHDLVREIVLAGIPGRERGSLHGALLARLRGRADVSEARIGLHAYGAGEWPLAAAALESAARRAEQEEQLRYACEYATRALVALERTPSSDGGENEIRLLLLRQRLLDGLARPEEQDADLARLERLLPADHAARPAWALARAEWLSGRGRHDEGVAWGARALADARSRRQPAVEAAVHAFLAREHQRSGRRQDLERHARRALALARRLGLVDVQLAVTNLAAIGHHYAGELEEARARYEEVRRLADEHGVTRMSLTAAANLAAVEQALGREALAIQIYRQVLERCDRLGAVDGHDVVNLAWLYLAVGRFEPAEAELDRADELLQARDAAYGKAFAAQTRAQLAMERGQREIAYPLLQRTVELASTAGAGHALGIAHLLLGLYHLERGELADARGAVERGSGAFARLGVTLHDAWIHAVRANVAVRAGSPGEAEEALSKARAAIGASPLPARALYMMGLAEESLGGPGRAAATFREAWRLVEAKAAQLPEELRPSYRDMPRVRSIAWAAARMERPGAVVELPFVGAPTGRSPRPCERVRVLWIPGEGRDVAARRRTIAALVDQARWQEASPSVDDLAGFLHIGRATIARDLQALRRDGMTVATRGSPA